MVAPPALWIGAALARATLAEPEGSPHRAQLLEWLAVTESVSHQFRGEGGAWYFAAGVQAPGLARSVTPTWAVPLTAGSRVLRKVPGATASVAAEVAVAGA